MRDLVVSHQPAFAMNIVQESVHQEIADYFSIQITKSRSLGLGEDANTVRFTLRSRLDGRVFEDITVDIDIDAPAPLPPETIEGSRLLAFSGLPTLAVPTLPIEIEMHAYSKEYGPDRTNTRVKDLIDMVLIAGEYELSASRMLLALGHTFRSRALQKLPLRLGPPPSGWRAPYAALARSVSLDPDIAAGHAFAAALLDPLLTGQIEDGASWQPDARAWRHDPAGLTAETERRWSS